MTLQEAAVVPGVNAIAARGGVTSVTHIATRQDMSRWTRAHADSPGINWTVEAGPGGTMLIAEHPHDQVPAATLSPAHGGAQ
jgi:hypothetical protein